MKDKKCCGTKYNFKQGTEWCVNRHDCKLNVGTDGAVYNNDDKERVVFKTMKEFRKCDLFKEDK